MDGTMISHITVETLIEVLDDWVGLAMVDPVGDYEMENAKKSVALAELLEDLRAQLRGTGPVPRTDKYRKWLEQNPYYRSPDDLVSRT